jgi:peptidoglycan/xylan/chitin deacetylase (PgdA/CDA1 family)
MLSNSSDPCQHMPPPGGAAPGRGARRETESAAVSDVIVLCYHALSPSWEAALSTTPERFERQIGLLVKRGYRATTFTRAVSSPPGERLLAITFDDAYRSVLELARPILERHGIPATVFAPTDFVGSEQPMRWAGIDQWLNGPHERELLPMSWGQLGTLAAAGWEIGSHTGSHPHLTEIGQDTLEDELARSKRACEQHLEGPCTSIAYPYGDVDERVVGATARAGYSAAAALPSDLRSRTALEWPRIGVYHADDDVRFRVKLSPTTRRLRRSAAWSSLDALRRLVQRA